MNTVLSSKSILHPKKTGRISKMQLPLELALQETASSPNSIRRWIKLCLSYVEFVAPSEATREPARILKLLSEYPCGLTRNELLQLFYIDYSQFSMQRQESLRICMEKIIQRARLCFFKYDLTIHFCRATKRYYSLPLFALEKKMTLIKE